LSYWFVVSSMAQFQLQELAMSHMIMKRWSRNTQSVQRQATGRTAGVRVLARDINCSLLHSVLKGSGDYPASYTIGTGSSFPEGKSGRGLKLATHLHLGLRSRMVELYLHSPIRLYGVARN
jgi:hypothetical protein